MVRGALSLHSLCVPVVVDNLPAGGGEQGDQEGAGWFRHMHSSSLDNITIIATTRKLHIEML